MPWEVFVAGMALGFILGVGMMCSVVIWLAWRENGKWNGP